MHQESTGRVHQMPKLTNLEKLLLGLVLMLTLGISAMLLGKVLEIVESLP